MQEDGLPLLRLGRKLHGHEVRTRNLAAIASPSRSQFRSSFIKSHLPQFAAAHPQVEFAVSPRPSKHPVIIGHYINGRQKAICVRNMEPLQIMRKAELLRDASGEKLRRTAKPVQSSNDSVRGIWSPFHGNGMPV
jgi:large subunit ribosomal protein L43